MGNIDADPGFVLAGRWVDSADPNRPASPGDTKALWIGGDYHLTAGSPCIDAGDPDPMSWLFTPDIDGVMRPVGPLPDIGCDEFGKRPPS